LQHGLPGDRHRQIADEHRVYLSRCKAVTADAAIAICDQRMRDTGGRENASTYSLSPHPASYILILRENNLPSLCVLNHATHRSRASFHATLANEQGCCPLV